MVHGMPWSMIRFQSSAFNAEDLAIFNIKLSFVWSVLVNRRLRTNLEEIGNTINMVVVPVCQECFMDCRILLCEHTFEMICPGRFALAGVNEYPLVAPTD